MSIRKLNILMCCHLPLLPTLGGAKVYIEAAYVYRLLGHTVKLVGIDEIVGSDQPFMDENWRVLNFPSRLANYLKEEASQFDIVEFESIYLPFSLDPHPDYLLVARSVLLDLHIREIKIPRFNGIRSLLGYFFKNGQRKKRLDMKIEQSLKSMNYSDFVNVPNPSDKKILVKFGIDPDKIIVQPYGLFLEKLKRFQNYRPEYPTKSEKKIIAFVGTFDNRKGAVEFPLIIKTLVNRYPFLEFKLLGVVGMFPDENSIYQYIGEDFKNKVQVIGKYSPDELPALLSDCSLGIFPSYLESFGFGVLEMMAMNIPVVGYDSPGINMLLLKDLTVAAGDVDALVAVFNKLITDEVFLKECIQKTQEKASEFIYETQKNFSLLAYQKRLEGNI